MKKKAKIIKGTVYGFLKIVREVEPRIRKNEGIYRYFLTKCICNKLHTTSLQYLRYSLNHDNSISCGCIRITRLKEALKTRIRYKKHGMCNTPEYGSWRSMLSRCNNSNASNYYMYGNLGIKICDRWKEFKNFYEDMGKRPQNTTLDRINTKGNYELSNCRWATSKEQNNNLSSNIIIKYKNETMCASDWSKRLGGCDSLVANRLKIGWNFKKAITFPVQFK